MALNERKDRTGKIKEVDLGLTDAENQTLAECRRLIADDADLNDLRDATLARYLRHNSWSVEPAIKQIREYLAWRKSNQIDKILENPEFTAKETIRTIIPYAYERTDKEGRPIYIEKTGMIATAALADEKLLKLHDLLHSHIYGVEQMQQSMYENSLARGQRINGITTILDFAGLGFHHRQCMNVLKHCLDFDKKYYPEYVDKLYVINTPWVAPYLFQAVQVFLDPVTRSRIQVIPGDPSEFLKTVIPAENLPKEYGGTGANVDVLDSSQLKAEEISGLDTQEVSYDFEKILSASSADGRNETFTWYFEVQDAMDIDFSIELLPASGHREQEEGKKVFIQKVQRLKTHQGTFKAPYPNAKVVFRWDNNFSYFNSKVVKYTLSVVNDDSGSLALLVNHAGQKQEEQKSAPASSSSS